MVDTKIKPLPVKQLKLDPDNPRLPAHDGKGSTRIAFYWREYFLEELVASLQENGYFEQEPMIVVRDDSDEESYFVLEGNRRLAALIQLLQLPGYDSDLPSPPPTQQDRTRLSKIPCYVADSRRSVDALIGFKHVGGAMKWSAASKARFIAADVARKVAAGGNDKVFAQVARTMGTHARTVREAYFAHRLLAFAREEYGINTGYVIKSRFGVWLRALQAKGVADQLNVSLPPTPADLDGRLRNVNEEWLRRIVGDMTPPEYGGRAILDDSRKVTTYGHIISNETAYSVLQRERDIDVAGEIVASASLAAKIERVAARVSALIQEAENQDSHGAESVERARTLLNRSRTLWNTLRGDE